MRKVLIWLALVLAGCAGSSSVPATGGSGASLSPIDFATVNLQFNPAPGSAQALANTLHLEATDAQNHVVFGPVNQTAAPSMSVTTVPRTATRLEIDYLVGTTTVGVSQIPISLSTGSTTLVDPAVQPSTPLDSITLTPGQPPPLPVGATQSLKATGTFGDGATYDLTASAEWSSANAALANVVSPGTVQGVAAGLTTVTAQAAGVSATAPLNVVQLASINLAPAAAVLNPGGTQQITASANVSGTVLNLTNQVTWTASNTSVAQVGSTGLVTAIAPGLSHITAALGNLSAIANVSVNSAGGPLQILPPSAALNTGGMLQLTAVETAPDGTQTDVTSSVSWLSQNTSLATVTPTGKVTAVGPGVVPILAILGETAQATCPVTISP